MFVASTYFTPADDVAPNDQHISFLQMNLVRRPRNRKAKSRTRWGLLISMTLTFLIAYSQVTETMHTDCRKPCTLSHSVFALEKSFVLMS